MIHSNLVIWGTVVAAALFLVVLATLGRSESMFNATGTFLSDIGDSWIARLAVNLLGYAIVLVPGYAVKRFAYDSGYIDLKGSIRWPDRIVLRCFRGDDSLPMSGEPTKSSAAQDQKAERTPVQKFYVMLFCFLGLQASYLTWGILQEKIMTLEYRVVTKQSAASEASPVTEKFTDSQFLVFVNRILAFLLSGLYLLLTHQPRHVAPLYKYSYCSLSNIMSSWCQYEALKYVSFPTQVLAKASKIIPVMLMGKLVSRTAYEYYEYVTAVIISLGMTMFMLGSTEQHEGSETMTTFSGVVILAGYMAFDSFTANWQNELFKQHSMTSLQMMCGVNLFSCLFTAVSLLQQGGFIDSFAFMLRHSSFVLDIFLLSLTSASGQLFIFYTISQFGPVAFVIMMTIRQGLAILLSCIIYHHAISITGILGVLLVFTAIFLRIYCSHRQKQLKRYQKAEPASHKV